MSRIVGLVGTLLLAKFLSPADYGEVSAAAIVSFTSVAVTTLGVGIYLVSNRDLTREETFHATVLYLATGVVFIGVVYAASGPIGRWSDAPNMYRFMGVFTIGALLDRLLFVPERVLVRQLRFRWLSLARAGAELTYTGVSVGLAAVGVGGMAIAWANLARSAVKCLAFVLAVDWRDWLEPHRLRWKTMARIISHGLTVTVAGVASYAMRRWDNLLVSHYFGAAVMGEYNFAYNLADTPAVAIGEQISDVIAASFPHVEQEKRAASLVRACTMISVIMFPLAFGLGAVAPEVVHTFFNKKWEGVGTMLMFLSVLSAPRPIANILLAYFYTCHRPRVVLKLEWVVLAGIVVSLATVGRLGTNWTCGAVGAIFILRSLAAMWAVQKMDGVRVIDFVKPLVPLLAACGLMVGAVVLVRPLLAGWPAAVRLGVEVVVGGVAYVVGALVIARRASRELLGMVRSALLRR